MPKKIPSELLVKDILDTATRLGRKPRCLDCKYSQGAFEAEFGSFNQALKMSGFKDAIPHKISRVRVLGALRELYLKHGRITYELARQELRFDLSVVERIYGTWSNAVRTVTGGTNTLRGVSDEGILEKIRETELLYGKATSALLWEHAKVSKGVILRRFGSFSRAYELAGVAPMVESGLQRWVFRLISKELGESIHREKTFPWLRSPRGGSMRIDGYIASYSLCIEFDGIQHDVFSEPWHKTIEYFEYRKECDTLKGLLLLEHGLTLIRFRWNDPISIGLIQRRLAEAGVIYGCQDTTNG